MPKTKISEFSSTPGNNTDIDGINIAEGCAPSGINDAIRELMAQLKDFQAGTAGDSFNGPVGTTTAAAGAFTTLSSTGNTTLGDAAGDTVTVNGTATFANANPTLSAGTANGVAYLNGSKVLTTGSALVFDGTNLGLGVTPSAWRTSSCQALQINGTAITAFDNYASTFTQNAYLDSTSTWRYIASSEQALKIGLDNDGSITFANAPSGTAGNAISFTQAMTLDASGNLGVGETSPDTRAHIYGANTAGRGQLYIQSSGTVSRFVMANSSDAQALNTYGDSSTSLVTWDAGSGYSFRWTVADTERARIDSSGNLLINTSSVTSILNAKLYVNGGINFSGANTDISGSSGLSPHYGSGSFIIYSGMPGSGTERARIDSSGNLLVGATSAPGGSPRLITAGSGDQEIQFLHSDNVSGRKVTLRLSNTNGGFYTYGPYIRAEMGAGLNVYSYLSFGINNAEAARIDSSGNLMVGTTSTSPVDASANGVKIGQGNINIQGFQTVPAIVGRASSTGTLVDFYYRGASTNNVGFITTNGTGVTYSTASDYRLKDNIAPMTGALAKVAALKPCTYKWKADGSDGEGFIAHELQAVVPQCVTGEKDAVDADGKPVYQGIDTSFLVATLTAAIQEQQAIIEQLKADVAALKAK